VSTQAPGVQVAGLWLLDTAHQILISHASTSALVYESIPEATAENLQPIHM
jgi:hypothetical protein